MTSNFRLDPADAVYSLGGHLVLGDASQVVAAAERGDGVVEVLDVEADAVVPHHHTWRG